MTKRDKIAFKKFYKRKVQEAIKITQKEQKMYEEIRDYLDYICRSAIDDFYSDYMPKGSDPIFYTRQYSLYKAYRIIVEDGHFEVDYNWEYMDDEIHGELTEYIYNIAFIRGYHGGATSGDGHPASGIPYWRTPFPTFDNWGRPAAISRSPYMVIEEEAQKYIDIQGKRWQKEILLPLAKIVYELDARYDKIR